MNGRSHIDRPVLLYCQQNNIECRALEYGTDNQIRTFINDMLHSSQQAYNIIKENIDSFTHTEIKNNADTFYHRRFQGKRISNTIDRNLFRFFKNRKPYFQPDI
tara:strand:+ start:4852 stop:5163 length:312 start_codon:yes stop_codon:yes gene_type:complete